MIETTTKKERKDYYIPEFNENTFLHNIKMSRTRATLGKVQLREVV